MRPIQQIQQHIDYLGDEIQVDQRLIQTAVRQIVALDNQNMALQAVIQNDTKRQNTLVFELMNRLSHRQFVKFLQQTGL